jgi:hypothetical protein
MGHERQVKRLLPLSNISPHAIHAYTVIFILPHLGEFGEAELAACYC